jgi:mono/diheme cytochrome c family protein
MVMKNLIAVPVVLMLAGVAFAQNPPAASPAKPPVAFNPGDAAAGEVIYLRYCAACHGRTMKGDGPVASGLKNSPGDLSALIQKNKGVFPYDKVAGVIDGRETSRIHGTPDMPVWGEIFAITTGTEAPSAEAAVRRITMYVWSKQEKTAAEKK